MLNNTQIREILDTMRDMFPDAECELNHKNPFELVIAVLLSAQCTDVRVNKVTEVLFKNYNTPYKMQTLKVEELGEIIRSCGCYKTKSSNIMKTSKILIDDFNGEVPSTMEELITLPGVGRKTANVVLSNAFDVPAIAVDTHVFRVSNRIGLAYANNVEETEKQLRQRIPEERWSKSHHLLIFQGRRVCKARKPLCEECSVKSLCLDYNK